MIEKRSGQGSEAPHLDDGEEPAKEPKQEWLAIKGENKEEAEQ